MTNTTGYTTGYTTEYILLIVKHPLFENDRQYLIKRCLDDNATLLHMLFTLEQSD